jgi:hypothetical protein
MTSDRNFEDELFSLYGKQSAASDDRAVKEQAVRRIQLDDRLRTALIATTAIASGSAGAAFVATFAGPLTELAENFTDAPEAALWTMAVGAAVFCARAAARLMQDT